MCCTSFCHAQQGCQGARFEKNAHAGELDDPRDLIPSSKEHEGFATICGHLPPLATLDAAQLGDASSVVLISICPGHVWLGGAAAHFNELVHLRFHSPVVVGSVQPQSLVVHTKLFTLPW